MQADFQRALVGYDDFHGTRYQQGLPRNPDGVLNLLDNYLRLRMLDGRKIARIVDFAETIVPAGELAHMPADDRNSLVILKRWAQNPGVASIRIPLPDETERLDVIAAQPASTGSEVTPAALAKSSAGLKRVQLLSLIADSVESGGLLEFVRSRFDLSTVAGLAIRAFGLAAVVFGTAHFVFAEFTASMVPAWLPMRLELAHLTGAIHAGTGLAMLLGFRPRIAAGLEAAMMTSFVLLVHLPRIAADPTSRLELTMGCIALALSSAAWSLAFSRAAVR